MKTHSAKSTNRQNVLFQMSKNIKEKHCKKLSKKHYPKTSFEMNKTFATTMR